MATIARPENALKRAEELINVGQKQDALQTLHDLITSKRYRLWQKTHEKIMFKYIELCVDMRKGRFAKDGLIQYRIICQQVNVNSLEEVIKHFIDLSTKKAESARSQVQTLENALDFDDLEADNRPEDLMLTYVSGEKGKDRSDRELVTPWFKFLWETYRAVLEILRNNSKLLALYTSTTHHAFQFCKQYKRTTEFCRLCDIIRNHLKNLNKYRDQKDRPDLIAPETLRFYLDIRFEQLKIATELQLWQEAFRSVEDIYGLMCMVKKMPKASLLAVYYVKLTEVFWKSASHLYHAYGWFILFQLQKSFNKNLDQKDLQLIASSVLLAALSVPPYDHTRRASHVELEHEKKRNVRMANLIGFNLEAKLESKEMPSRSSLLAELVSKGVMTYVNQEVKDLYHLLEHECLLPLDITSKVQPLLIEISKIGSKLSLASFVPEVQLSQYVPALEKLATLRLLQQVSNVYQSMKIESLSQMIPFFCFSEVEKISVDAVRHNFIAMKVDHVKGAVIFGDLGLESQSLQNQLGVFAESLNKFRTMIYPPLRKLSKLGEEMLLSLADTEDKEHKRLLARKSIIEKHKEEQERHLIEMEREEESKRLKLRKVTEEVDQKRLASECEQRKNQRILRKIEERELEEAQTMLQEAENRSKRKGKKPIIGEKLTKQTLMELALNEKLRERQEMEKKLQKIGKTMDYLERAKRVEETPLIEAAFQHRLVEERAHYEQEQQREIELSRKRHVGDLEEKNRLARMVDSKEAMMSHLLAEYESLKLRQQEMIINFVIRWKERDTKRKMLYYLKTEEERLSALRLEEEARKLEEAERRKREEAEHRAKKLDEIAKKQRQREHELEERERLRKEASLDKATENPPTKTSNIPSGSRPWDLAPGDSTAAAPSAERYVPRFRRPEGQAPPAKPDQRSRAKTDDHVPPPSSDRRGSNDCRPSSFSGAGGGSR